MDDQETGYDYCRYKQLLAEAVDETKRLELIDIMIKENARERLEAQRMSDRAGNNGGDGRQGSRIQRA